MTAAERPPDRAPDRQADLPGRVHDMIYAYVDQRTHARTGIRRRDVPLTVDPKTQRQRRNYSREYADVNNRICETAFLAMRSRRSRQDFLDYFTSTFCATPSSCRTPTTAPSPPPS